MLIVCIPDETSHLNPLVAILATPLNGANPQILPTKCLSIVILVIP